MDMDYVIIGSYAYQPPILKSYAIIVNATKGEQVSRFEGEVEYPGSAKMGLLFFSMASFASQSMGVGELKEKKWAPYLNNPKKSEALKFYVAGRLALQEGAPAGIQGALDLMARAIQDDYNYVHGYLGYAQTLVQMGFMEKLHGKKYRIFYEKAKRELQKAEALNPILTKHLESGIFFPVQFFHKSHLDQG